MNNIRANEFIRNVNACIKRDGERNAGIVVGMLLALRIMGYDAEQDENNNVTAIIKRYGTR